MKVTLHPPRIALISLILLFITFTSAAQEIASFSMLANTGCSGTIFSDANLTTAGVCRGPGIAVAGGGTYNSNNWYTPPPADNNAINPDHYLEWSITPDAGYRIDLNSLDIKYDRSGTGPSRLDLQVDFGSGFTSVFADGAVDPNSETNTVD
ncbi:MAG: hypothetical protein KJO22_07370, partial [Bacteroidia bacterium]|nr:hypothetical protein [Bacteroidia bacterium]